MYVRINRFGGIQPAVDPSKLPDQRATVAAACRFESANLRTYSASAQVAIAQSAVFTADAKAAFFLEAGKFFVWQDAVSAVRGPMPTTAGTGDFRVIYAGDHGEFSDLPRWTTRDTGAPAAQWRDKPSASYILGVPRPGDVPTVSKSAPPSGAISAATKADPCVLTIDGGAALESGHRLRISGGPSTGDGAELQGAVYTITKVSDASVRLDGFDSTGWAADLTGLSWTWTREYSDVESEQRIYCYTLVREIGALQEEGPPSEPSALIAVPPGAKVNVTTSTAVSRPYIGVGGMPTTVIAKKRLYRSLGGSRSASFSFVAEIPATQASFIDTLDESALGEVLATDDYDLPVEQLRGLVALPNGVLAGYKGNVLHLSEPYQPSFWPSKYRRTLNHEIVGLGVFGDTIVCCTKANPVLVQGIDPGGMSDLMLDQVFPAVDETAICSSGFAVFYVSSVGIVQVDANGARVITASHYTPKQWQAIVGSAVTRGAVHAAWWDNRLVARIGATSYVVTFNGDGDVEITTLGAAHGGGFAPSCFTVDRAAEALYFMQSGAGPSQRMLHRFDPPTGSAPIPFTWRSRIFHLPREVNMAAMQVFATAYHGGSNILTVKVIADGVDRLTANVTSQNPIRLPGGFLARDWQVEVTGNVELEAVHLADNVRELRDIAL